MDGDYRSILREELEQRCKANPRYSLRAFARDLGLSPSGLSRILREHQGLSGSSALRIARKMKMSSEETERFRNLVIAADGRSRDHRKAAQTQLAVEEESRRRFQRLELDVFRAISDWYHYAILELV